MSGPNTVAPGQDITLDWTIDTADFDEADGTDNIALEDVFLIVEVYDCVDGSCDSEGDENVDVVSISTDQVLDTAAVYDEQRYNGELDYTVPGDANGPWAASAYFWAPRFQSDGFDNDGDGEVDEPDESFISADEATYQFYVDGETTDDGSTGGDGSGSAQGVKLEQVREPQVSVTDDGFTGRVFIENTGDEVMAESYIVEMQVRPSGRLPLSVPTAGQSVCDPAYPENVYNEIPRLDPGESTSITLRSTQNLAPNTEYTVYFLTRTECAGSDGNERVGPYEFSKNAGNYCLGTCDTGMPVTHVVLGALLLLIVGGGVYLGRQ